MEELRLHKVLDGALIASKLVKTSIFSIAVSRDDEFVALGIIGKVLIYSTSNLQLTCSHDLPPDSDSDFKCQRVWFSTDSRKVIAVTRNTRGGDIYTYISDCISPSTNHNMPHINIPSVSVSFYSPCSDMRISLENGPINMLTFQIRGITKISASPLLSTTTHAVMLS